MVTKRCDSSCSRRKESSSWSSPLPCTLWRVLHWAVTAGEWKGLDLKSPGSYLWTYTQKQITHIYNTTTVWSAGHWTAPVIAVKCLAQRHLSADNEGGARAAFSPSLPRFILLVQTWTNNLLVTNWLLTILSVQSVEEKLDVTQLEGVFASLSFYAKRSVFFPLNVPG